MIIPATALVLGLLLPCQAREPDAITARLIGNEEQWFGLVMMSVTGRTEQIFHDVPPLLADTVVIGVGATKEQEIEFRVFHDPLPMPVQVHAQGLLIDEYGLAISGIEWIEVK